MVPYLYVKIQNLMNTFGEDKWVTFRRKLAWVFEQFLQNQQIHKILE